MRSDKIIACLKKDGGKISKEGFLFVEMKEDEFKKTIALFSEEGFILVSLFCEQRFDVHPFMLFYVFERTGDEFIVLKRPVSSAVTSIARIFPAASWFEREVTDGFGIVFSDAFDARRLFLHEHFPGDFHPLLHSTKNSRPRLRKVRPEDEYVFRQIAGAGVYQIPVGPVHAGIIEPGHFRFSVIGETIFNLEVRMFYKHRGIEKLAEGKNPKDVIKFAEAVSGDETVANASCFCRAVESICNGTVPRRAEFLRGICLELERMYSLLSDIAGMIIDIAYPVGASQFFIFREELLRKNAELTGSRFMKGMVCLGGVSKDMDSRSLSSISAYLEEFQGRFKKAHHDVLESPLVSDRFETTGIVEKRLVPALSISGPIGRACGFGSDTRIDHPYGIYLQHKQGQVSEEDGDVLARFNQKAGEVLSSAMFIMLLIDKMPRGDVVSKVLMKDGFALSHVESPRGQNSAWVHIKEGRVCRYKVKTASFCNWQAIEHAVMGNIVPDFPLINKSFNLSYAGADL